MQSHSPFQAHLSALLLGPLFMKKTQETYGQTSLR